MSLELQKCSPFNTGCNYRVLAIDPGTTNMGIAIGDINTTNTYPTLLWAEVLNNIHALKQQQHLIPLYGERFAKLQGFREYLSKLMVTWDIHVVVCETNYMKSYPTAYASLTECLYMIRETTLNLSRSIPVVTVEPSRVKVAVGAKGNEKGKEHIKPLVMNLPMLRRQPQSIESLGHDAVDAIAIFYWASKHFTFG